MTPRKRNERLAEAIAAIPSNFHTAGTLDGKVLKKIASLTADMKLEHTVETGSGKSTLLLSHLSPDHTVFALDQFDGFDVRSISAVMESNLFNAKTTRFIVGPTQDTLPHYKFTGPLDFALIDGPHGYPFPELEYYYFYPHLRPGALLVIDDIHIPTIARLFDFLRIDEMFELVEVVVFTAFFRRTKAPTFNPRADGWWLQGFNMQNRDLMYQRALKGQYGWVEPAPVTTSDTVGATPPAETANKKNWHYVAYNLIRLLTGKSFADRCLAAWRSFWNSGKL